MLKDLLFVLLLALGLHSTPAAAQPVALQVPKVPTESAVLKATDDNQILIKNIENLMLSYRKELGRATAHKYAVTVVSSSTKVGIDPIWIVAMMWQESRFDLRSTSSENAIGLMQILPSTGRAIGYTPKQLRDPVTSIKAGVSYLATQKKNFGDIKKATTAYNQGSTRVRRGTARMWYFNEVNRHYQKMKGWIAKNGQKQQRKPRVV
jgi:soluble lytic murein transglycosylase-like protein